MCGDGVCVGMECVWGWRVFEDGVCVGDGGFVVTECGWGWNVCGYGEFEPVDSTAAYRVLAMCVIDRA